MNKNNEKPVILFVKYPQAGAVKTRLGEQIGADEAAGLYKCFAADLIGTVSSNSSLTICYDPSVSEKEFIDWLGVQHSYIPQSGSDLGARMKNAFEQVFDTGLKEAVLIGSDAPDLPIDLIDRAFSAFETYDAVIGPSSDGGYYLIGFSRQRFLPEIFDGISWSTETVFQDTMKIFDQNDNKVRTLPLWYDIDTVKDLKALILRNEHTAFRKSETIAYLQKMKRGGKCYV